MQYLFFDLECADGIRAICEFGYVLCNENFEVIKSENILINPQCEISLRNREGQKDLELSHSFNEYLWEEPFIDVYEDIRRSLTNKDFVIFGFSVENDIRYLMKDCDRYNLEKFNYDVVDVQKLLPLIDEKYKNRISLDKAASEFINNKGSEALKLHNAQDDAMRTFLIYMSILEKLNLSLEEILTACPQAKVSSLTYWNDLAIKKREKRRQEALKEKRKVGKAMWTEFMNQFLNPMKPEMFVGTRVTISYSVQERIAELRDFIDFVRHTLYAPVDKLNDSDFLITFVEEDKQEVAEKLKDTYKGQIMTMDEFMDLFRKGEAA